MGFKSRAHAKLVIMANRASERQFVSQKLESMDFSYNSDDDDDDLSSDEEVRRVILLIVALWRHVTFFQSCKMSSQEVL